MAESSIVQIGTVVKLRVPVSGLEKFTSPHFMVQGVPWSVETSRRVIDNEEWLSITLFCKKEDKSRDWVIAASSTIRLIPFCHSIVYSGPFFFDYMERGAGVPKFIRWNELFDNEKRYVKNGAVDLNIAIEIFDQNEENASELLVDLNKCCDESSQVTLRLTVNNIDNLMAVRTSEFLIQNLHFDLTVFNHIIPSGLGAHLSCKEVLQHSLLGTIDFKLASSIDGVQDIKKTATKEFQTSLPLYMVPWAVLFKPENGFVVNNTLTFEVKVKVTKMDVHSTTPRSGKRRLSSQPETDKNLIALECGICSGQIKNQEMSSTLCGHLFCTNCITDVARDHQRCPSCNAEINLEKLHPINLPL